LVNTDIREVFIGQKMQEFCHRMIHPAGNIWIRSMGHKKFKVILLLLFTLTANGFFTQWQWLYNKTPNK
jgi:uncharacterized membrane protein